MGSAERRAVTDEMLARIDAVVSGHEHQRTTEFAMSVDPEPVDDIGIALDRFFVACDVAISHIQRRMIRDIYLLGEAFATINGVELMHVRVSLPPRFRTLVKQAIAECRQRPVPAKAAHRRRYGRG